MSEFRLNRSYPANIRNGTLTIARLIFEARSRREAVHKACNYFWYKYKGALGPIHKAMVVADPYHEVHYDKHFICNDRMNKLLAPDVILRVITESHGELIKDTREGRLHNPPNSVRRVKRRRDFGKFIAPNIKKMCSGTLYYRIVTVAQKTANGTCLRKRKYIDIRLEARSISEALAEIEGRELVAKNARNSERTMRVRSLLFTAHVAGLIELDPHQRTLFNRVLPRYEEPRK